MKQKTESITELKQWLLWKYIDGRKCPIDRWGKMSGSTRTSDYLTYEEAEEASNEVICNGIAFCFTPEDDFIGIDLDDAIVEHPTSYPPKPWASAILDKFAENYCEISPSLTGYKIFAIGKKPEGYGSVAKCGDGQIEVYSHGRFFCFTNFCVEHLCVDRDTTISRDCQEEIDWLFENYFQKKEKPQRTSALACVPQSCKTDNFERCQKYVDTLPESVSGQGGHSALFRVACECIRFGLSDQQSMLILDNYNATKCEPHWNERELQHKLRQANKEANRGERLLHRMDQRDYGAMLDAGAEANCENCGKPTGDGEWCDNCFAPTDVKQRGTSAEQPATAPRKKVVYRRADQITTERVEWLWDKYIPLTGITFIDGDPEAGKTCLALHIIAAVTNGTPLPNEPELVSSGEFRGAANVMILAKEDRYENVIKPRLVAAGADETKIFCIDHVECVEPNGDTRSEFITLPRHTEQLTEMASALSAKLFLIDPYDNHIDDGLKTSSSMDMRKAYTPISEQLSELSCALLIIRHFGKTNHENAKHKGLGSIGLTGMARSNLACVDDGKGGFVFGRIKGNLSRQPMSLVYQIKSWHQDNEIPVLHWCGQSECDVRLAAVKIGQDKKPQATKTDQLGDMLAALLKDGPRDESEVREIVLSSGLSESLYKKGRKQFGIESYKDSEFKGKWMLRVSKDLLPECEAGSEENQDDL